MARGFAGRQTRVKRRALPGQVPTPARRFLRTEAGSASLLLAATVVALLWANSPWSDTYEAVWGAELSLSLAGWDLSMDLKHWVVDGLMALFFFAVGLEVRREFSVGELTDRRRAAIAVVAALGGMVVPAVLYLLLMPRGEAGHGWGVVIGTDTAFLLGALAVVGPAFATQLRVFLLTLTVIDDIMAVSVIGIFYSESIDLLALLVALLFGGVLWALGRVGVWRATPYVVVVVGLWLATVESGLHAAIAGMLGGLLVGAHNPVREEVERAALRFRAFRQSPRVDVGRTARSGLERAISVNERLQAAVHPWASYVVVPLFALANAGVDLRHGMLTEALRSRVTWAVVVALVVGKLVGISVCTVIGVRFGVGRLPRGVGLGHVFGGAALSGIGFTVSLLIAWLAFDDPALRDQATVGVLLAAVLATAVGWVAFRVAARFGGRTDADLPRRLDPPVDAARDNIRGAPDAPLTLVEYGDFECPFCSRATGVTRELRARFGPNLRYVFRHLPLADVHPHAEFAARAAVAAQRQGRFWEMHDILFDHQDELDFEDVVGYASELGLDVETFLRDLEADETAAVVRADLASAEASGARGTPTFFVGAVRHVGPHDTETLAAALEASRNRSGV
ncbi:Na+/H+ antiporter NhaA [Saccharomonospora cyanea]|uniref:Na(+)/H(+) antiporter NhaA n=1 Tax=Saccharomonospora cyanea NA-134 TaxID=882082 RepID=H5XNJ2_9PSEU|nr:Na+/H+ antiporter NhaA [Saccharomonospora cyanea]EHR61053.1 Na+/H+ antiporter NhaA [Saccharomonospora cyanea NA-134]